MDILDGTKVLLLEDDYLINEATADLLREFGCEVTAVFEINEAIDALEKVPPQIAVLDINIRGEQSYAVADRLDRLNIPIVFVTGYDVPAVHGRWSEYRLCRKPCDPNLLKGFLANALQTHKDRS